MKQELPSSNWRGGIAEENKTPGDGDLIPGFNLLKKLLNASLHNLGFHLLWETEEHGFGVSRRFLCVPGDCV